MTPAGAEQGSRPAHTLVGYTAGVFDLFHVGHLHLFRHARDRCSFLIAGVTTDELALAQKGQRPVVAMVERMAIVQHVRYVDHVVPQASTDKVEAWQVLKFDVLFAGDNLRGSAHWQDVEGQMAEFGVSVVYLPATHLRSGDLLSRGLTDLVSD